MNALKIAVGSDFSGYELKRLILETFQNHDMVAEMVDVGVAGPDDREADHVQVADSVAQHVAQGRADRGLLFCGNGLGVAIAANEVDEVRAVTAHDLFSVRTSITGNEAQVLCMGAKVIGPGAAAELIGEWLRTPMPAP